MHLFLQRNRRFNTVVHLVGCLLAGVVVVTTQQWSPASAHAASTSTAAFVPVAPCRLADTHPGTTGGYTRVDALNISIAASQRCGIPSGATSLALTLTVAQPQAAGFLTAWPANQVRPTVSNLNFQGGQVRANSSITQLDATGSLRVFTSVPTYVLVDVVGAFVPSGARAVGRFVPRSSSRLYDSRPNQLLNPGGSVTIPLPAGVPSDAVALALNVTVTESLLPGFVTAFPAGTQRPFASILNVDASQQTRAAGGILPVSSAGITLFLSGGGHVIVDYSGYFTGPSAALGTDGLFTASDPTRLMDTRLSSPLGVNVPIYPLGGVELSASQAGAMAYNVTSVEGNAGYMRAFPAGTTQPETSTLNMMGQGDVVANFAITQSSTRGFDFWSQPQTHLVVDLQGWFSGAAVNATLPPPGNTPPPPPPPADGVTYSACTHDGLDRINAERARYGVSQLYVNPLAQAFACDWALSLAQVGGGLTHSDTATRDAAVGCPTGENIAFRSGTSTSLLMDLWFASAPHHTNIVYSLYNSVGLGYITRYDPVNGTRTYGVTDFALC